MSRFAALSPDPPYSYPPYRSSGLRAPRLPLLMLPQGPGELNGPLFAQADAAPGDKDLTSRFRAPPIGERINVSGRITDAAGRPVAGQLVEIWQANAAGRYDHEGDQHLAPLDPNFDGAGRCLTDDDGRYRFLTVRPGGHPWHNHPKAWRPAHINFSVFGRSFLDRLVTQMYFPGDPLLADDPLFGAIRNRKAAGRLVASFDLDTTEEGWALGYRFDVVLGEPRGEPARGFEPLGRTPSQAAGPFTALGVRWFVSGSIGRDRRDREILLHGQLLDGSGAPVTDALLEFWQADDEGRFPPQSGPDWTGFGRCFTDAGGYYRLRTLKPAPLLSGTSDTEAPHVNVSIFAAGLLQRLVTRCYFSDEVAANLFDPVLASIDEPGRRASLIAGAETGGYRFDVRLQGDRETVFFMP